MQYELLICRDRQSGQDVDALIYTHNRIWERYWLQHAGKALERMTVGNPMQPVILESIMKYNILIQIS